MDIISQNLDSSNIALDTDFGMVDNYYGGIDSNLKPLYFLEP